MKHGLTRIVVATHNRGKLREIRALLAGLPVDVCGLSEVMESPPPLVEATGLPSHRANFAGGRQRA
jgi:inosine/xanthosine triphosphate pyrophosphatase family protein